MTDTTSPTNDFDSPWKNILETFLPQLLELLFPQFHASIDWSKGYISLDKELQKLSPVSETSTRNADKLFQVYTLDGQVLRIRGLNLCPAFREIFKRGKDKNI